jgi:hypothetical protein
MAVFSAIPCFERIYPLPCRHYPSINISLKDLRHADVMKRAVFIAILLLLLGVDVMANDARMTRDVFRALDRTGDRVVRVIDATVAHFFGRN